MTCLEKALRECPKATETAITSKLCPGVLFGSRYPSAITEKGCMGYLGEELYLDCEKCWRQEFKES